MSKQQVASDYRASIAHLGKRQWPTNFKAIIFGYAPDNIGGAIYRALPYSEGYTEKEVTLPLGQYPSLDRYDAFVFNNASNHLDWIEDWSRDKIEKVISDTLTATITSIANIAKIRMNSPHRTKIVVIGSMAHKGVLNGSAPYCAAKAGLQHFVRCVAYELAPKGFEIFCVNPSNVQGAPMSEATIKGLMRYRYLTRDQAEQYWAAECPMGEFLTMKEVADTVADLIMNDRKYLSGSAIDLIGGQR